VGIFYDGPDLPLAEGYLGAHYIKNLLGHFGLRGELIRIEEYRPGQLARYRAAFYNGTVAKTKLPTAFVQDVRSFHHPFCWLGEQIDRLLAGVDAQHQLGFHDVAYQRNGRFWQVEYKGVMFPRDNLNFNIVELTKDTPAEVWATAILNDDTRRPYVLKRNRFWYFADSPFAGAEEGSHYVVFCDLLHDILEINHPPRQEALARMEDVSAEAQPNDLRAVADVLSKRSIPFQIATIPLYRNPLINVEMRLSDRPKVVDAIHYMIDHGGTPVMHGWSHQYHSSTGDDYEFWDEMTNSAIASDSTQEVLRRLDAGLAELFACKLFPIAFETPHYAASETDYKAMQQVFTLFYDRSMVAPNLRSTQFFPYPVIDEFGRYIVPENLGYLPMQKPDPKIVIGNARCMRTVRDGIASFYFHPFLNPNLLQEVLKGISDLGYHFVSLRQFSGEVDDAGHYMVRTRSGSVQLSPRNEFWRLRRFDTSGKLLTEQTAAKLSRTQVKVDVDVPPGGWAALDCFKEPPGQNRLAQLEGLVRGWWSKQNGGRPQEAARTYQQPHEAWILWLENPSEAEANNQESYRSVLGLSGFSTRSVSLEKFSEAPHDKTTLLVVPDGVAALLSENKQKEILRYLSSGGLVLADGHQKWLPALGFRMTGWHLPVAEIKEVLVEGASFSWEPEELAERYTPPPGSRPLVFEPDSKQAVAIAGQYGAGHYLYLSVPLDPHTRDGDSHYPYFTQYLAEVFHIRAALRSGRLEAYFDPGYRQSVNPDHLAEAWKRAGIRTVYAAGWHFYERYTFDYAALIRACHRNGISVYAWFMFPQITPSVWVKHPEWRERAASGADGRPGWRYLMNLQNPGCFRAAMDWAKELLHSQEWDGINIAELNFDAEYPDYLRADRFVPMNNEVRADFRKKAGFDPAQLFTPTSRHYHERDPKGLAEFLRYREDVVTEWHRRVLKELDPVARERGLDVIVTMMDSLHSRSVQPALGVDSRRIVALMKEFNFTLQVEDPAEHWAEPPERYRRFAETYRKLVPDTRRLMFDVNVVADRELEGTSLPSALATGTELARTVMAAAVLGRVAIYSEYTVNPEDWPLLSAALARPAKLTGGGSSYQVNSPFAVLLNSAKDKDYFVDGQPWPVAGRGGVLIPPGHHRVSAGSPWFRILGSKFDKLQTLSCDVLEAHVKPNGLALRYASAGRAAIVVNQKPQQISIDGHITDVPVQHGGGDWVLSAPRGEHLLEVITLSRAGMWLHWYSRIWSSSIVVVAAAATLFMLWFRFRLR
jgi:hypothetical protein